jgi:hypothetical protein
MAMQQLIAENVSLRQRVTSLTHELVVVGSSGASSIQTFVAPNDFVHPSMTQQQQQPATSATMARGATTNVAPTRVRPPFMAERTADLTFRAGNKFVHCSTRTCGQWLQVRVEADVVHCPKCSSNTPCPRERATAAGTTALSTHRNEPGGGGGVLSCVKWIFS